MPVIRHLKVVGPANVKRTVGLPVRKPNAVYRSREHLTEHEVERLVEAAKDNPGGPRTRHPARPQGQAEYSRHASPEEHDGLGRQTCQQRT